MTILDHRLDTKKSRFSYALIITDLGGGMPSPSALVWMYSTNLNYCISIHLWPSECLLLIFLTFWVVSPFDIRCPMTACTRYNRPYKRFFKVPQFYPSAHKSNKIFLSQFYIWCSKCLEWFTRWCSILPPSLACFREKKAKNLIPSKSLSHLGA